MRLAAEITEAENLFETLASKSPVGLCIIQDGKFCYTNPTFQNATGYREDELLGRDSLELVVPEDREWVRENAVNMLKGKLTLPYQFRVTHKNGSIKCVMESVAPVQYSGRQATLGNFVDITAHKQAEEALQAEKNKLQSLIDTIEDHITIRDRDYNLIYMAEHVKKLWGDRTGEKCYRVFEGQDKVCDGCPAEKAFSDGKSHTSERKTVISGEVAFWENTANPIRDAGGRVVSCLELAKNITERKKAEQALADEATRRRILVDQSRDGIVVLDENGKVYEANQRFAEMLGYTLEEVRELHMWDWDTQWTREQLLEMVRSVDETGDHFETYHRRKDGTVYDVEISTNGAMCGGQKLIFCVGRDITERKQAEEALQAEKNKLQSLIDAMEYTLTIQDTEYNIIYQNEPARIDSGDRLGEKCYRAYEGSEKVCDGCPVEEAFKDGKPHTSERQRVLPSGEVTFWENTSNPIRDAKGEVVSCLEIGRNITERKKAEKALRESEERSRSIVENSQAGIIILDDAYRCVYVNDELYRISGYSREEVIGQDFRQFLDEESKELVTERYIRRQRGEEVSPRYEFNIVKKDGQKRRVEISSAVIKDSAGEVKTVAQILDITERKRMEEALRDSEEKLRKMFESVTDGILVIDLKGIITEVNQRTVEMHGFASKDELLGRNALEVVAPRDRERIAANMRKALKQGIIRGVEYTLLRANGTELAGELSTSVIKDASGKPVAHITIARDITERKKAEEAIKLAAEEWRKTFDSITDAISIHDRDFQILRANKAFADIFHKKPSQIIGGHCYELHKGGKPRSGCPHKQTLATKEPAVAEFYESNLEKYLHESTSPIFDEKGEVVGTVHITRDITEQKQQNERLMMADRLASIGELAAGTAHELNNPLTSVIGFSQLLMERDIPDDIREDLNLIYSEAQRAAGVTKNLLAFARKHAPVKQLNQINNIIEDVLKLRAYEQKVNGIEIKRQLAPDLPEIEVDYFQMQQVFLNIIINAEYFTTEVHNRGTLTITTKKQNNNVRISIADDGPGISRENLSRIFNPFFTTKEAGKGTGLGLSICHGIVSEHGGQVYARSQPGKGATIVVELPINSH